MEIITNAFVFFAGVITIGYVINFVLKNPNPSDYQMLVFRVVLALGAACFATIIPGFIEMNGKWDEIAIRASGSIVIFIIVYRINPPKLLHDKYFKEQNA